MVDDMVILLGDEQKADEAKKEQCEKDIDETEDKHKQLNVEIADLEKATGETKEAIATLSDEIVALTEGIKNLDKRRLLRPLRLVRRRTRITLSTLPPTTPLSRSWVSPRTG